MTKRVFTLVCVLCVIGVALPGHAQKRRKTVRIGVVLDGEVEGTRNLLDAMRAQVSEIAGGSYDVQFPPEMTLPGSFQAAKISTALDTLLANSKVDVIWTFGVLSSMEATRRKTLARPVIAPFIIDRRAQGLPFEGGRSGLKNLNYIAMPWSLERDLTLFKEVTGTAKTTLVIGKYIADSAPQFNAGIVRAAKAVGMELTVLGAKGTAAEILAQIPKDVTSVFLAPLAQTSAEEKQLLIDALNERRIAIYASQGEAVVRNGALVGRRPNSAVTRVARRVALHTVRILGGDDAGRLPVALNLPERLVINMQTARKIGVSPSFMVLTEAELINPARKKSGRELSLAIVTRQALEGNVSIKALTQVVAAGRASIKSARSVLLPQASASTTARVIDKDRAEGGFGNAPQFLWNGELGINQVLYSEGANAGLSAEKSFQVSREQQLVQTKWDIAAEVGVTYLNVLRLKTAERINRSNLKVTRANLELARMRFDAGSSSKADVYRWESKIAIDRKSVIEASAQRNVVEADLQRILNRPPEESFVTAEVDLQSDETLKPVNGVDRFIGDPLTFRLFRRFMIEEAVARAPEIKQFDAAIAAQERLLLSSSRRRYAPTVAASAGLTQRFDRRGAGTTSASPTPPNGTEWFAGVTLSIPLLEGGGAVAEIQRQSAEVLRLERERDDVRNRIAQRATASLHLMGASNAGIRLSRESAEAARKNFELIAASYAEGAARIVDLLDAQNAWVTADQLAADSVYGFIIDVLNTLRAVGHFDLASDPVKLKAFLERAEKNIAKARALEFAAR